MSTQLFVGSDIPQENLFKSVVNQSFVKPRFGLWTSSFDEKHGSDWFRWCRSNDFYTSEILNGYLLTPKKESKIYTIDCYEDLEKLMEQYKETTPSVFGFSMNHWLDFEEISNHYDAIHLTEKGQWETRSSRKFSLYGWDCECMLWLHWSFEKIEKYNLDSIL